MCKVIWYEEGEKTTHYFLNMEKQNHNNKVINSLRNNQNEVIHDKKIHAEQTEEIL